MEERAATAEGSRCRPQGGHQLCPLQDCYSVLLAHEQFFALPAHLMRIPVSYTHLRAHETEADL
eukprot:1494054-Rhodomonas_salina.1